MYKINYTDTNLIRFSTQKKIAEVVLSTAKQRHYICLNQSVFEFNVHFILMWGLSFISLFFIYFSTVKANICTFKCSQFGIFITVFYLFSDGRT